MTTSIRSEGLGFKNDIYFKEENGGEKNVKGPL